MDKKFLSIFILLFISICTLAQNGSDTPVTGVAVHLTEEQQARFDTIFSHYTDPEMQARNNITRILNVGIPHRIDETALIERLEQARETWKSWKSGNSSIDTATAFDVLSIPMFPGEPDFILVYDGYYSTNERSAKLRVKGTLSLPKIVVRYKCEPDCELQNVSIGGNWGTYRPMPVFDIFMVGKGVLHGFKYELGPQ